MTGDRLARLLFLSVCTVMVFVYGVAVGRLGVFPYGVIDAWVRSVHEVYVNRDTVLDRRPNELLQDARGPGRGVTRLQAEAASPGLTLINSFFEDGNEIRLMRLDGSIVHRWPIRFFDVSHSVDYLDPRDVPNSEWNVTTHGVVALPDGSVVFNFEFLGAAKLDRCGVVQWTVPRVTHHSIEQSEDGSFWIPGQHWRKDESPFPALRPPYNEDTILKVSAKGQILQEISVLDIFFRNELEALLFANGLPGTEPASTDFTHLNDVEELTADMAASFPQFATGDLLLSMRNLNLLMVVDPRTELVKWHQTGPWIAQHDPDFQPDGLISVFSNNNDGTVSGYILGGSSIMQVNPATGKTTVRYGGTPDSAWYSYRRGKQQYLPNGNVLITESEGGRVFEVDPQGDIVWEFVNRYDEDKVAVVMGAIRYPEDYFDVWDWACD